MTFPFGGTGMRKTIKSTARCESDGATDRVGHQRAPTRTHFRPGQSGNSGGRPKAGKSFLTLPNRIVKRYEERTGKWAALADAVASFEGVSEQRTILGRLPTLMKNV
jgi:hypothetical protein